MRRANRGKAWETQLDFQHDEYRRAGVAVIFHAHPEVRVLNGKAIRSKGPPDYFGVAAGVPVLFDAKKVAGPRFSLSNIKPHQAKALEAWVVNGGRAGVALKIGAMAYWVDWTVLGPVWWGDGRRSVDVPWLDAHAKDLAGRPDWLAAL